MIRHDDRGPIPCLAVGHALRWAEGLIPITCLAVGLALRWAEAVVTSASGDGGVWGVYLIYVLHIAFVRLFPFFLTTHLDVII